MKRLNSILLVDKVNNKCEFGIYNKGLLLYIASIMTLYIPFKYYDNFNYRKGFYYVLIDSNKVLSLQKIECKI